MSLSEALHQLELGTLRVLVAGEVVDPAILLDVSVPTGDGEATVLVQSWEEVPPQEAVIADSLRHLAELALSLWPSWDDHPAPEHSWRVSAEIACRLGVPPVLRRFSPGLQLRELARVLEVRRLVFLFAVGEEEPLPARLLGLVRSAEWIGDQAGAASALLVPEALTEHPELEPVIYRAIRIAAVPETPSTSTEGDGRAAAGSVLDLTGRAAARARSPGAPHHNSQAERVLKDRLDQDPELRGLVEYNGAVRTARGSVFRIDVLWREGRVAIEVDGFGTHGTERAFYQDRDRDYELTISGYAVLRLPHGDVLSDVEIAVEKIRDVVHFRRRSVGIQELAHGR